MQSKPNTVPNITIKVDTPVQHFTNIFNGLLWDDRLSWAAKGLACFILSKHKDWDSTVYDLAKYTNGDWEYVKILLTELKDYNYLIVDPENPSGRRFYPFAALNPDEISSNAINVGRKKGKKGEKDKLDKFIDELKTVYKPRVTDTGYKVWYASRVDLRRIIAAKDESVWPRIKRGCEIFSKTGRTPKDLERFIGQEIYEEYQEEPEKATDKEIAQYGTLQRNGSGKAAQISNNTNSLNAAIAARKKELGIS